MKKVKTLSILMVFAAAALASCGGKGNTPTGDSSSDNPASVGNDSVDESIIKSLVANKEAVVLKVGMSESASAYYTLTGNSKLTTAQKKVTVVSSDESVVKISGTTTPKLNALAVGECTITVTSNVEADKTCSFKVTVEDSFFDLGLSMYDPSDDLSKDMEGEVRTSSTTTAELVVRDFHSTTLYVETKMVVHGFDSTELWPKLGIFVDTADYSDPARNRLYYFLNAEVSITPDSWQKLGVTECAAGDGWAWNAGIDNATARHQDSIYLTSLEDAPTYEKEFKLGLLRNGLDFYFFFNDTYVGSCTSLESLFTNQITGENLEANVGFFEFNADVTFKDYRATADADEIAAKLPTSKLDFEWMPD